MNLRSRTNQYLHQILDDDKLLSEVLKIVEEEGPFEEFRQDLV